MEALIIWEAMNFEVRAYLLPTEIYEAPSVMEVLETAHMKMPGSDNDWSPDVECAVNTIATYVATDELIYDEDVEKIADSLGVSRTTARAMHGSWKQYRVPWETVYETSGPVHVYYCRCY